MKTRYVRLYCPSSDVTTYVTGPSAKFCTEPFSGTIVAPSVTLKYTGRAVTSLLGRRSGKIRSVFVDSISGSSALDGWKNTSSGLST